MTDRRNDNGPDSRDDRLRQALRANLARRKAQARARADRDDNKTAPDAGGEQARTADGPDHRHWERPPSRGNPHRGCQERLPDADARDAADRSAADADQCAAPVRHPHHDRAAGLAWGRGRQPAGGPGSGAVQPCDDQPPGGIRHRAQDACLDPGAGADAGAGRRGRGVAARRLRDRLAARGPAPARAGGDGRDAGPVRRAMSTPRHRRGA